MPSIIDASIHFHTTASSPRPHILYVISVKTSDNKTYNVTKRYSEFLSLQTDLVTPFSLPQKRILVTAFIPSAWLDDALIAERKAGLSAYIQTLIQSNAFRSHPRVLEFLSPLNSTLSFEQFNPEDAVPSTLSRKAAAALMKQDFSAAVPRAIAAAYYPDWSFGTHPPQSLDYSKFSILFFAFATPNAASTISWDSGSQAQLQTLVSSARCSGHRTKVVLSIGGWSGCYWFSGTMSTAANRAIFVNACVDAVNTYGLDGIDIDWEYPNNPGAGNPYSPADSANLLSFFTSLRTALGPGKIISAAVTDTTWSGTDGYPLTNVSAYAAQLTYVNIMNYDVWGATLGPNAPLSNGCGNSTQPAYSAQAALDQWTAAGFPASKLLLGLPLYGYVIDSTATSLTEIVIPPPTFPIAHNKRRAYEAADDARDGAADKKIGIRAAGDLSSYYGQQIAFSDLVANGALVKLEDGTYAATNGYTYGWDNCSDTPFLYDQARSTVVTYDDTYSLADKAALAKNSGMAGCFTWSLDQDDGVTLQNVIRASLGLKSETIF